MTQCSYGNCEKKILARGLCGTHYRRARLYGDPSVTLISSKNASAAERLARFTVRGEPDSCWEWSGHRDKNGYGSIRFEGRRIKAHTLSYIVHSGSSIPAGLIVRHRCDNPPCVNPNHLVPGTHAQNSADMVERGRSARRCGEDSPRAKLTRLEVEDIRRQLDLGRSHSSLARLYSVSRKAISKIAHGITWKESK